MRKRLPHIALLILLLLLAIRLTISESLPDSYFPPDPSADQLRQPGPATTVAFTIVTLLGAAAAAFSHRLTRRQFFHLLLIVAILALAACSVFHASNHFSALIDTCDLAMALIAGWAFSLLLGTSAARQLLICLLLAVGAVWLAKSANQYFLEIPDSIDFYQKNKPEIIAQHHWEPGDPGQILFEGRMNSRELTGFSPFANAFAAALLVPLLLSTAFLAVGFVGRRNMDVGRDSSPANVQRPTSNALRKASKKNTNPVLSSFIIHNSSFLLLFLLTALAICFTESKGATGSALIVVPLFLLLFIFSAWTNRHRRLLTFLLLAAAGLAATITLAYGITHHGLPSLSLLYRWQYWTGSLPIIQSHPFLGVGLNNFGSYYLQFKLPFAPEDVTDPHSFFIRLAAEIGLPATLLIAGLLACLILRPLLTPNAQRQTPNDSPSPDHSPFAFRIPHSVFHSSFIIYNSAFIILWFLLRVLIAEPLGETSLEYTIYMNIFYALAAAAGFFLAASALRRLPPSAEVPLLYALLAAALGMFLYDQINMALVTGPVAMLFWTLLAAAQPQPLPSTSNVQHAAPNAPTPKSSSAFSIQHSAFLLFLLPALALGFLVFIPLLQNNFPWDPSPPAHAAAAAFARNDPAAALSHLAEARARDPRSLQLLRWQIQAKLALHQPIADDIREFFARFPSDARSRLELAQLDSDLPIPERLAALQKALTLDAGLEPKDPKRLTESTRAATQALINQLLVTTQPAP